MSRAICSCDQRGKPREIFGVRTDILDCLILQLVRSLRVRTVLLLSVGFLIICHHCCFTKVDECRDASDYAAYDSQDAGVHV